MTFRMCPRASTLAGLYAFYYASAANVSVESLVCGQTYMVTFVFPSTCGMYACVKLCARAWQCVSRYPVEPVHSCSFPILFVVFIYENECISIACACESLSCACARP